MALFITALATIISDFRNLWIGSRIYLVTFCFLYLLSSPILLLGSVVLPLDSLAEKGIYEFRNRRGFLGFPGGFLIKKQFIFEQEISEIIPFTSSPLGENHFLIREDDSIRLTIPDDDKDTTIVFPR